MATHTIQEVVVRLADSPPWWMRWLPWQWQMRLLRGRPLAGEAMIRCGAGPAGWEKIVYHAGYLGGLRRPLTKVPCPVCKQEVGFGFIEYKV